MLLPPAGAFVLRTVKIVLEWVSIPVLIVSFQLPQGLLLYWLTNSTYSILSNFALRRESIKKFIGSPVQGEKPVPAESITEGPRFDAAPDLGLSDDLKAQFEKAAQYRADNKLPEALDALTKIATAHPDLAQGHYAKGRLLSEMKAWDKAAESYSLAGKLLGESPKVRNCEWRFQFLQ